MYDETFEIPAMGPGQTNSRQVAIEGLAPCNYDIVVHIDSQAEVTDATRGNNLQTFGLLIQ